ncbi:MAG: ABC transporter ATP-binding protein, partial [Kiritimatiellaeota bacterium]|nr:ABC transporter ATP-binding protein [Kiritimatiellota bacterium]
LTPTSGVVELDGEGITGIADDKRSRLLAVVGQNSLSPMPFTVRQVVEMGRSARVSRFAPFSDSDRSAVATALAEMDVERFADRMFNALSGGERQRAKIAAALAQEPEVLLLDEPTSQLDMGHAVKLMKHLKKVNEERGTSILVVSHDIQLLSGFMRDFILMRDGAILASGKPESVLIPSLVAEAYDCEVEITQSPSGGTVILPSRTSDPRE